MCSRSVSGAFLSTALGDVTEIKGLDRDGFQTFAGRYVENGRSDADSGRLVIKGTHLLASQVLIELADNWPLAGIAEEHGLDQEMLAEFLRALSSTLDQISRKC